MTVQENSNFSRENRLGGYYRERKSASLVKQIEKNLEIIISFMISLLSLMKRIGLRTMRSINLILISLNKKY